jgi:hypothetical protein
MTPTQSIPQQSHTNSSQLMFICGVSGVTSRLRFEQHNFKPRIGKFARSFEKHMPTTHQRSLRFVPRSATHQLQPLSSISLHPRRLSTHCRNTPPGPPSRFNGPATNFPSRTIVRGARHITRHAHQRALSSLRSPPSTPSFPLTPIHSANTSLQKKKRAANPARLERSATS